MHPLPLFSIPALYCPFETFIDADRASLIAAHTEAFLRKFDLLKSEVQYDFYKKQRFADMIASSYPLAEIEAQKVWCDLNTLLFLVDDDMDETTSINSIEQMNQMEAAFLSVIGGIGNPENDVLSAFQDIVKRLISLSTKDWMLIFAINIKEMFAGGVWQLQHLIRKIQPSIDEYVKIRQYLGAAHLATDSIPFMARIDLPSYIYNDEDFKKLTVHCRNAICYSNDLFSLAKEITQSEGGAEFNLVTILSKTESVSLDEAIQKAVKWHDKEVQSYIETCAHVQTRYTADTISLEKYFKGLQYLMTGNIYWSTKLTSRYPHIYLGS